LCDVEEAKESLGDSIDIIALIGGHLKKNKSPYISIVTHCTTQKKYCHCNIGKITEKKLI
jgi:nitrate reductase assembly molybdenum cofactor insertion protein NarJ